jgi:endonuclease G, mitochondrial
MTKLVTLAIGTLIPALLVAQPNRFSSPECTGPERELADRSYFLLCYDSALRVPRWTAHELHAHQAEAGQRARRPSHFRSDEALVGAIARDADYRASGYSRGHMVPAGDLAWSEAAVRSTFVLSNAVPQRQSVNGGSWRRLETLVREVAACSDATYIVTGPLFSDPMIEQIGAGVAVPTHTFKVVLTIAGEHKAMYAAIVPNALKLTMPLSSFMTTVAEVERLSGFDFFRDLADDEEHRLESTYRELVPHGLCP